MVSRKAIAVAGLSAIALAASGCSGDSDTEAESTPATTTEQVETQPPAPSAVDITKVRAAFKERYGTPGDEASWWGHITGVKVSSVNSRTLEITTDFEEIGNRLTGVICRAGFDAAGISGFDRIEAVVVVRSDGREGLLRVTGRTSRRRSRDRSELHEADVALLRELRQIRAQLDGVEAAMRSRR